MGTWGPAILSNDFSSDLKAEWKELLGEGYSPEAITEYFIKSAKEQGVFDDLEEKYEFWISLAFIQWKTGRLQKIVKNKAQSFLLPIIIEEIEKNRWDNKSDYRKRIIHLDKLKIILNSEQPKPKKIRKPYRQSTNLKRGDIFTIKLKSNKYVLLEVLEITIDYKSEIPTVILYNYLSDEKPNKETIKKSNIMCFKKDPLFYNGHSNFQLGGVKKSQNEPINRIEFIKRNRIPSIKPHMPIGLCFWDEIDKLLEIWIDENKNIS